jgi:hypothetical protein
VFSLFLLVPSNSQCLNFQPLHLVPIPQMLLDDLIEILFIHIGVPGALGIDDDDRTFLATIQASGGVDADFILIVGDAELLDLVLDIIARLLRAVIAAASFAVFALIGTEENMLVEKAHGGHRVDWTLRDYTFRMRHR